MVVGTDTPKETAQPSYINSAHIAATKTWVHGGGVGILMTNDTANCDIPHFNQLATRFGIQFRPDMINPVVGTNWESDLDWLMIDSTLARAHQHAAGQKKVIRPASS